MGRSDGEPVKDHCGYSPSSRLVPSQNQAQRGPLQYFNRLLPSALMSETLNTISQRKSFISVSDELRAYLRHRQGKESFQSFATRHEVKSLQEIFSNEE